MAHEAFEERAAILEFDAGLTRAEAERRAWALQKASAQRPYAPARSAPARTSQLPFLESARTP